MAQVHVLTFAPLLWTNKAHLACGVEQAKLTLTDSGPGLEAGLWVQAHPVGVLWKTRCPRLDMRQQVCKYDSTALTCQLSSSLHVSSQTTFCTGVRAFHTFKLNWHIVHWGVM